MRVCADEAGQLHGQVIGPARRPAASTRAAEGEAHALAGPDSAGKNPAGPDPRGAAGSGPRKASIGGSPRYGIRPPARRMTGPRSQPAPAGETLTGR